MGVGDEAKARITSAMLQHREAHWKLLLPLAGLMMNPRATSNSSSSRSSRNTQSSSRHTPAADTDSFPDTGVIWPQPDTSILLTSAEASGRATASAIAATSGICSPRAPAVILQIRAPMPEAAPGGAGAKAAMSADEGPVVGHPSSVEDARAPAHTGLVLRAPSPLLSLSACAFEAPKGGPQGPLLVAPARCCPGQERHTESWGAPVLPHIVTDVAVSNARPGSSAGTRQAPAGPTVGPAKSSGATPTTAFGAPGCQGTTFLTPTSPPAPACQPGRHASQCHASSESNCSWELWDGPPALTQPMLPSHVAQKPELDQSLALGHQGPRLPGNLWAESQPSGGVATVSAGDIVAPPPLQLLSARAEAIMPHIKARGTLVGSLEAALREATAAKKDKANGEGVPELQGLRSGSDASGGEVGRGESDPGQVSSPANTHSQGNSLSAPDGKVRRVLGNRASAKRARQRKQERTQELEELTVRLREDQVKLAKQMEQAARQLKEQEELQEELRREIAKVKATPTCAGGLSKERSSNPRVLHPSENSGGEGSPKKRRLETQDHSDDVNPVLVIDTARRPVRDGFFDALANELLGSPFTVGYVAS